MKLFLFALFFTLFFSCSPKMGSTIISKQKPLSNQEFVLILQKEDDFYNDGIEIGTIKSGDNGLSVNCTYNEVIGRLKQVAQQNGANLIKITERKAPGLSSTCEKITAKIFKVPEVRKHEKEIEWTSDRKLTWEDFKGKPKPISNTNSAAQTYCGFGFETNRVTMFKKTKIFTKNIFNCNLSWVRPDQKNRQDLLEHEQGHFDLCEVYTRQLRKKLEEKKLTVFNLSGDANIIFKELYALYLDRQELYEKETSYGIDTKRQTEWTNKISRELSELNTYR